MEVALDEMDSAYRLLAGSVVPRPIAWVSSRSPEGRDNLAPHSFFNVRKSLRDFRADQNRRF